MVVLEGCSPCSKLSKKNNIADKDSAAFCFFKKKQYESAALLFEELLGYYRGSPRYEMILYQFALTKFKLNDFTSSSFYFQQYVEQYPNSPRTEDAAYNVAESFYRQSNIYELDQSETYKAIDYMELFTRLYPASERNSRSQDLIKLMRGKLSRKAFLQADLYFKIGHYKAAVVAFRNLMLDYPESPFREEVLFKTIKASVLLADNSIEQKQEERYQLSMDNYLKFVERFPESKYMKEAQNLYAYAQRRLESIRNPLAGSKKKKQSTRFRKTERKES
jgi:outer membrane protein assembly factor BamD